MATLFYVCEHCGNRWEEEYDPRGWKPSRAVAESCGRCWFDKLAKESFGEFQTVYKSDDWGIVSTWEGDFALLRYGDEKVNQLSRHFMSFFHAVKNRVESFDCFKFRDLLKFWQDQNFEEVFRSVRKCYEFDIPAHIENHLLQAVQEIAKQRKLL